ncbi:MAG TPA: hypothetical protein DDZ80_31460 [Cyanobacteria bacterium UBA8803]|nr:hypothetical protein [Cyanobacteria bacterium UBA9273]HBL62730.1 hypothetical protein [Cyanobacteria bacterium UBA8803]
MQAGKFFSNQDATEYQDWNSTEISIPPSQGAASQAELLHSTEMLLLPIGCLVLSCLFLLMLRLDVRKARPNKLTFIKDFKKVSCSRCKFFDSNPYIKCAVHPSKVLSAEARDCPDYCPKE